MNNPPFDRRRPYPLLPIERESVSWVPMALVFAAGMVAMFGVMA